jgi:plastocyanin
VPTDEDSDSGTRRTALLVVSVGLGVIAVLVPVRIVYKQTHKPEAQPGSVTIANYDFGPTPLKVAKGAKVRFTNADEVPHTATADDQSFDSGTLANGQSFEVTVQQTVSFHCDIHPTMQATLEVGG